MSGQWQNPDPMNRYELLRATVNEIAATVLAGGPEAEVLRLTTIGVARLLPGAPVAAIEVPAGSCEGRIAATANAPASWLGRILEIDQGSAFGRAIQAPAQVVQPGLDDAGAGLMAETPGDPSMRGLACTAIHRRDGSSIVMAAWIDRSATESRQIEDTLQTCIKLLGAADMAAAGAAESGRVQKAIARAKQEWECTVDALPQLVCVLDGDGRIIRANRAIETWSLGKVDEIHGRAVHDLLHPGCDGGTCGLAVSLAECWQLLRQRGSSSAEIHDAGLGRVLDLTMRTIPAGTNGSQKSSTGLAIVVLSDITMLHSIQADLQLTNEQLETRIEERTRDANASREELSILSGQLMTAQEDERKRIAQELHDGIGQSLSAIKYSLERAEELTHQQDAGAPRHLLRTTISRVQESIDAIRTIAMDLRPSMLDDFGPVSAVRWLCREFGDVYAHVRVHTDFAVADDRIPERLRTPIFRTVQESLNNIAKHAQAKNVFVSLRGDGSGLALEIRDDGIGFHFKEAGRLPQQGHGLSGLRERATKTGGSFSLRSKRHAGTVVRIGWPQVSGTAAAGAAVEKGFTLLELLVVMVIIGILAGFVAPRYFAQVGKSQVKAAMAQIDAFDKALDQYRIDMGRYPTTEEGLAALMNAPPNDPAWTGPYLKKAVPTDPWGKPYVYVSPGTHGEIDIVSYGKDGRAGGIGENADVTSW